MNKAENRKISSHIERILFSDPEDLLFVDSSNNLAVSRGLFIRYLNYYKRFLETIPGKEIILIEENSLELATLYFAALLAGKIVIPVDPLKGSREISEIIHESNCKQLIIGQIEFKISSDIQCYSINPISQIPRNSKDEEQSAFLQALRNVNFNEVYSINYTSGTTGRPKGVMHSFRNHYLASIAFAQTFGFSEKNVFYHNLPMTYMAGMLNLIFMPFLAGSKIVIGKRFSVEQALHFWETPVKYNVNTFFLIPAIVTLLNKIDRGSLGTEYTRNHEITACIGTAPLFPIIQDQFQDKYKIRLYESYGLSETLFVSSNSPGSSTKNGVGKLLNGVEISFDEENEILINCPWMFKGYQNIENEGTFRDAYFLSGDIGELSSNGDLRITDRKKDIIIKGGINLSPKKIEYLIQELIPGDFVILGIKDESYGEIIACIYTGLLERKEMLAINDLITKELGRDYQIDHFRVLEYLPRNRNGKTDKKAILKIVRDDS